MNFRKMTHPAGLTLTMLLDMTVTSVFAQGKQPNLVFILADNIG